MPSPRITTSPKLAQALSVCLLIAALLTTAFLTKSSSAASHAAFVQSSTQMYDGLVRARSRVIMLTPTPGVVAQVLARDGTFVEEGQLLVRLDDRLQTIVFESANLAARNDFNVRAAKLTKDKAEIDLSNVRDGVRDDAVSEWELRRAVLERDLAELRILAAEDEQVAAILNAQAEKFRLEELQIRAPFNGYVNLVLVQIGQRLAAETQVLEIVDLQSLEAEIMVPSAAFGKLRVGETYQLRGDAPVNSSFSAHLTHASQVIDPASRTFRCVFEIDNSDQKLPAGFVAWFDGSQLDAKPR